MSKDELVIGGRYNFVHQKERIAYIGACGRWHQFAKIDSDGNYCDFLVWCEILDSDLSMIEETKVTA